MRRAAIGTVLLLLASCSSTRDQEAGAVHLTIANRTIDPQQLEEMWIAPNAVRIHRDIGPDGAPKTILIARLDTGVVWEIDPARKSYTETRFDWLSAKMDKGDGPEYQVVPFENADVAGHAAEGFLVTRGGRGVGKVWVARDLRPETSTAMAWRVYHRFRGFTNVLRGVPGVIVKQELDLPDYAFRCEAQAASLIEEAPADLFDLPAGCAKADQ